MQKINLPLCSFDSARYVDILRNVVAPKIVQLHNKVVETLPSVSGFSTDLAATMLGISSKDAYTFRSVEKCIAQQLGYAYEEVFGCMSGFERLPVGGEMDVVSYDGRVGLEIKSADNTMNASSTESVRRKVINFSQQSRNHNGILVIMMSDKPAKQITKNFPRAVQISGKYAITALTYTPKLYDEIVTLTKEELFNEVARTI